MVLSDKENLDDAQYTHLKMLSFAYKPCYLGLPITNIFGIVIEVTSKHLFPERKLFACYDSGFSAYFSSHGKANINGREFADFRKGNEQDAFEHFIGATNEMYPDPLVSKKSRQLLKSSAQYLTHTTEVNSITEEDVQIWFLTHSGIAFGAANIFEIKNKTSLWTKFYKEGVSISKDLEMFRKSDRLFSKAASF